MPPICLSPTDLVSVLPREGLTLLSSCSAESGLFDDAILAAEDTIADATYAGIFVPGYNKCRWMENAHAKALTFFMTPELRAADARRVDFRPLRYANILALLRRSRPQAALFMVSPPNEEGICSFGTSVDFIADLWHSIPIRIAHINPMMPATRGDPGIPFADLTAWCEAAQPLLDQKEGANDAIASAIADHVVPLVSDGATLQTGLGKVPGSVLRGLSSHRNLRIHSGLIGDPVLDLLEAGALAWERPITAGVAIGSQRLYDMVGAPAFEFRSVSVTHGLASLAAIPNLVTINSAIEVDLFGQAYAELTPAGLMSGPGGAADFAQGARAADGTRIVVLPSTAARGAISRIVAAGAGAGPVSLGRNDIDVVVTEYGAADLRNLGYEGRARALMAIADPAHRDALAAGWHMLSKRL
jgi:acyl-CoA hydrolase